MKKPIIYLLLLVFISFGCKDDDIDPLQRITGTYVYVAENYAGTEFDYFQSLELRADGTVYGEGIVRDGVTGEDLGYFNYYDGTYSMEDLTVTVEPSSYFQVGGIDFTYAEKEDLLLTEYSLVLDQYTRDEKFSTLQWICPPNTFCIEELPLFVRVAD